MLSSLESDPHLLHTRRNMYYLFRVDLKLIYLLN